MDRQQNAVRDLSHVVLFADLSRPELFEVIRVFEEEYFDVGSRILRQGIQGSNFYVIVDGDAAIRVDGKERERLSSGDYFGEISLLLGEAPPGDVVALTPLRCLVLPGDQFEPFMIAHPPILYRMLQAEALQLHASKRWQS